jgi:hypothetical protein
MERRSGHLHSCARSLARICKTGHKIGLFKTGQRTPLERTNNVVLHTDQERCCVEDLAGWSVSSANRRIAKILHGKAVSAGGRFTSFSWMELAGKLRNRERNYKGARNCQNPQGARAR